MSLHFFRRRSENKKTLSMDVVPQRFCQIFQYHGVEKSQIPRLMPQIKLNDLKSNEALLAALTLEILDQTARLFGIRSEWLEGVDDVIYESRYCYKAPELLFELLDALKNHSSDFNLTRFPLRVLVSNKNLDYKSDRDQLLVPVVLEKVNDLGDETIHRYYIFNDGFNWNYEPARIQLKAMARIAYKLLGAPIPFMVVSQADLQSVLDRKKISRKFLDGCLITDPSLEDFALTSQESVVAAEVDEIPIVLKYIEEHKLESFYTAVPHSTSPAQATAIAIETTIPTEPLATTPRKTGKRAENTARWESVRTAARTIWAQDKSLAIEEVVRRIQKMPHLKMSKLTSSAIRKHIADLAPGKDAAKPGRKRKKSL
jgi:hypothetical protein